jgi:alpha-tubulin suppressor-like RCC1 family protein
MSNITGLTTGFTINGVDIGPNLVTKAYIDDVYPGLVDTMKIEGRRLWMWGANIYGALGTGNVTSLSSPVQTIASGIVWKQISSGVYHTSAIKTDGTLWLWGANSYGEIGDNSTTPRLSPVQTVSGGNNWRQTASGLAYTAAIKTDGSLWVWGNNSYGQLGTGNRTHISSPVQTVSSGTNWQKVSAFGPHTAAIKTDGTLWVWGSNSDFSFIRNGQLGDGSTVAMRSSPVQTIAGGNNWQQITAGLANTAAIKTDGSLWVWGNNEYGQLGTSNITHRSSPVQTVSGGNNWRQVSSSATTAAIKTDGTLWMWGFNESGEIGDNTNISRSSPVQTVSGGNNWREVSAGDSTMAIKTDGTLWVWGDNSYGQLGTGNLTNRSSPVQTIMGGGYWVSCSQGFFHSGAIYDGGPDT